VAHSRTETTDTRNEVALLLTEMHDEVTRMFQRLDRIDDTNGRLAEHSCRIARQKFP
jgi:hypothetical protein